ncbi:MAG: hypothetical protein ABSG56_02495 [Bryobacteraceae bacterium]
MIDSLHQALARLRAFFRKVPLDRDLDAEVAAHLAFAIEENLPPATCPRRGARRLRRGSLGAAWLRNHAGGYQ